MFETREVFMSEPSVGARIAILFALLMMACAPPVDNNTNTAVQANGNVTPASRPGSSAESTVTIESPDGVRLVGSLFKSGKPNSPALLVLHQWQSDRHSYDDLAKQLQAIGFTVLTIDGRGFGESVKRGDGTPVMAERTDASVKAMLGDVGAAFAFLSKQENVDASKIGILGASYGSSLALIYAADHPEVGAVALLSPGVNYFGNMPIEPAVRKFKDRNNPNLLFIAAEDDKESADAVNKLDPMQVDSYLFPRKVFPSGGHGTALLKVGASETLSDFFADRFDLANQHVKR
jgi:dienelactone hydrolase